MSSTNQVNNLIQSRYNTASGKNSWDSAGSGGEFMDVLTVEIKNNTAPKQAPKSDVDSSVNNKQENNLDNDSAQQPVSETKADNPEKKQNDQDIKQANSGEKTDGSEARCELPEAADSDSENDGLIEDIEPDPSVLLQVQTIVAGVDGDVDAENTVIDTDTDVSSELTDVKKQNNIDKMLESSSTDTESDIKADKQPKVSTQQQSQVIDTKSTQENLKAEKTDSDNPVTVSNNGKEATSGTETQQNEEGDEFVAKVDQAIDQNQKESEKTASNKDNKPVSEITKPVEKDNELKKDSNRDFEQDYRKVAVSSQQQNETGADTNSRDHGRNRGFNYSDEITSLSGANNGSGNTARDINELLGTQAKSDDMKIDTARTVDNVVKSVKTMVQNGNSSMIVRLDPPELGQLSIKISSDSNGMTIEIQATNAKTQQMLQQNSSQLRSALENSGVNINNLDVQFKPDLKNNANAGSDSQDNQQGLFDQNNSSFKGNDNQQQPEDSIYDNQVFWSENNSFEESQYEQDINRELSSVTANNWQELDFDTVDVTV